MLDGGRRRDPLRCDGQPLRAEPHHRPDGVRGAAQARHHAPLDVHLMVKPVDRNVPDFAKAGATYISFHPEASDHVERTMELIRENGCKPGLVLNPATPCRCLDHTLGSSTWCCSCR